MKRIFATILLLTLLLAQNTVSFAQAQVGDCANEARIFINNASAVSAQGFYGEAKITIWETKGNTVTGSKSVPFYNPDGVLQWTATLTGYFTYDGVTSSCTGASCSISVQNGNWSESANNPYYSGNSAFASVTMVRKFLFVVLQTESINITLTCDATGHLS